MKITAEFYSVPGEYEYFLIPLLGEDTFWYDEGLGVLRLNEQNDVEGRYLGTYTVEVIHLET